MKNLQRNDLHHPGDVCLCVPHPLFSDGISVTGLPISSPLRQVLKSRSDNKPVSGEPGKSEYSHVKVGQERGPGLQQCIPPVQVSPSLSHFLHTR